jgi:hypothetical protein
MSAGWIPAMPISRSSVPSRRRSGSLESWATNRRRTSGASAVTRRVSRAARTGMRASLRRIEKVRCQERGSWPPVPAGSSAAASSSALTRAADRCAKGVGTRPCPARTSGSSCSPSSRLARSRARQTVTVRRFTPSRATAVLLPPSAQASTIRARSARPCAVLLRRDQLAKVRRSSSDSTSGVNLGSGILPAHPTTTALSPPSKRSETERDSSGDGTTQDRDTRSGSPA